jgi:hypothetical protein
VNAKHRRILRAIFARPVLTTIRWSDVESLLLAIGCSKSERAGSRVRFCYEDRRLSIHKPHGSTCDKGRTESVRDFLEEIDVTPDDT